MSDPESDAAPGWDAIDEACRRVYGEQVPRHVGYHPPMAVSLNLQGCSAYDAKDHWHYVTYGLSELYAPGADDDPRFSGWGFELSLRVDKGADETEPPGWPFTMVNELAKYVNGQSVLLEPGHRIDLRRPVTGHPDVPGAPDSRLTVWALTVDPELGSIETPHGQVAFLQLVGVTEAEKTRMVATSTAEVLATVARDNPKFVVDVGRADSLPDEAED